MEPFLPAQKRLESEEYVMIHLLVPYISNIRDGLNHALEYLKLSAPAIDTVEIAAKKAAIPCVGVRIVEDFHNSRGHGESVLVYREETSRQLQGIRQEQVVATSLDSCTKWLFGMVSTSTARSRTSSFSGQLRSPRPSIVVGIAPQHCL